VAFTLTWIVGFDLFQSSTTLSMPATQVEKVRLTFPFDGAQGPPADAAAPPAEPGVDPALELPAEPALEVEAADEPAEPSDDEPQAATVRPSVATPRAAAALVNRERVNTECISFDEWTTEK